MNKVNPYDYTFAGNMMQQWGSREIEKSRISNIDLSDLLNRWRLYIYLFLYGKPEQQNMVNRCGRYILLGILHVLRCTSVYPPHPSG